MCGPRFSLLRTSVHRNFSAFSYRVLSSAVIAIFFSGQTSLGGELSFYFLYCSVDGVNLYQLPKTDLSITARKGVYVQFEQFDEASFISGGEHDAQSCSHTLLDPGESSVEFHFSHRCCRLSAFFVF